MDLYYIRYAIYVYILVHTLGLIFLGFMLGFIASRMVDVAKRLDELVREIQRGKERA